MNNFGRTPRPDNLHGYHCTDYFTDGWAEKGYFDEPSRSWVVKQLKDLSPEQRIGFFAIGGPDSDGMCVGYRYGHHGVWALNTTTEEFVFVAPSLAEFVEGRNSRRSSFQQLPPG